MSIEISIDDVYGAVVEYRMWCKKHGYNPELYCIPDDIYLDIFMDKKDDEK